MNWIELMALNNLYTNGEVKLNDTLKKSGEINYLINSLRRLETSHNKLFALDGFAKIYEKEYLEKYNHYQSFLSENGFLKPQLRFEESDINVLVGIKKDMKTGNLLPLREQIIKKEATVRIVSLMFFKNEKYLLGKEALINSVKALLQIKELADDKDLQYKYVLECNYPKCIVLCENIDFLKRPTLARTNNIELWYAGGKNVNKLDFSDTRGLPIYYSCDWDFDGLFIIYPLVKQKIPTIQLLTPNGPPKGIEETEHKSKWTMDVNNYHHLFNPHHLLVISSLITTNQWIIEESNNLVGMVELDFALT